MTWQNLFRFVKWPEFKAIVLFKEADLININHFLHEKSSWYIVFTKQETLGLQCKRISYAL